MKHVQEERKCFLDCLEDSKVRRKKLEQVRLAEEEKKKLEEDKKKLEEKVGVILEGKKELEWSRQRQLKLGFALILSLCLFVIVVMSSRKI
ncbi:hypothetical protein ACE6H2_012006 [Prunus campanulata]